MPRRTTEEIIAEHDRVRETMDHLGAILGPILAPDDPDYLTEGVIPAEHMRALVRDGKATASEVLSGARQGLNDMVFAVTDLQRRAPDLAARVLSEYTRRTGRGLWTDVVPPKRQIRALLQQDRISNECDWYLLEGAVSNLDSNLLSGEERLRAERMMADWQEGLSA